MNRVLTDIGDTCLWVTVILAFIWIIQYTVLARWWRDSIGVTLIGEAVAIIAIYMPSVLAQADPQGYAGFAQTTWYHYLAVGIVVATAVFFLTRNVVWERERRKRKAADSG